MRTDQLRDKDRKNEGGINRGNLFSTPQRVTHWGDRLLFLDINLWMYR